MLPFALLLVSVPLPPAISSCTSGQIDAGRGHERDAGVARGRAGREGACAPSVAGSGIVGIARVIAPTVCAEPSRSASPR